MSMGSQAGHVLGRQEQALGEDFQTLGLEAQLRTIKLLTGLSGGETTREERRALAKRLLKGQEHQTSSAPKRSRNASAARLQSMCRMSATGLRGLLMGLPQGRLDQLVLDSLNPRLRSHRQQRGSLRFDTSGIDALVMGASRMVCPEAKAIVFQAAVRAQDLMEGYPVAERLAEQIAALLQEDIKGIFAALRLHDPDGMSLVSFLKAMFSNKSPEARHALKELLSLLMHGGKGCSFSKHMEQRNDDLPTSLREAAADCDTACFTNAANLGYVAGATEVALSAVVIQPREQAAILNHVFIGALKASGGVTGHTLRKTHVELEQLGFYYIISALDKGEIDLMDGLYNLAFPRTSQGRPVTNEEGPGLAFKESFDHLVLSH